MNESLSGWLTLLPHTSVSGRQIAQPPTARQQIVTHSASLKVSRIHTNLLASSFCIVDFAFLFCFFCTATATACVFSSSDKGKMGRKGIPRRERNHGTTHSRTWKDHDAFRKSMAKQQRNSAEFGEEATTICIRTDNEITTTTY